MFLGFLLPIVEFSWIFKISLILQFILSNYFCQELTKTLRQVSWKFTFGRGLFNWQVKMSPPEDHHSQQLPHRQTEFVAHICIYKKSQGLIISTQQELAILNWNLFFLQFAHLIFLQSPPKDCIPLTPNLDWVLLGERGKTIKIVSFCYWERFWQDDQFQNNCCEKSNHWLGSLCSSNIL